jgi:GxxExxY protein
MIQENAIARSVVDAAYKIHVALGPGLLESVYERVLAYELVKRGHRVAVQIPIPIVYEGMVLDDAFRADLIVDELVIIELKSVEQLQPVHKKQLTTYLKLANKRLGLLINFGAPLIKDGIIRIVNHLPEEQR